MSAGPFAPLGIFGGAFDPVHHGHLRAGFELLQRLELQQLRWMPTGRPAHRTAAQASPALRVAMLRAAIADQPGFVVDERELHRAGPSYTFDTLVELRAEFPQHSLCLIVGLDAFLGLPGWHRWRQLRELAHLIVVDRPGWMRPIEGELADWLVDAEHDPRVLRTRQTGVLLRCATTPLAISSSDLRALLARGEDPRYLVPESVRGLLLGAGCYASPT